MKFHCLDVIHQIFCINIRVPLNFRFRQPCTRYYNDLDVCSLSSEYKWIMTKVSICRRRTDVILVFQYPLSWIHSRACNSLKTFSSSLVQTCCDLCFYFNLTFSIFVYVKLIECKSQVSIQKCHVVSFVMFDCFHLVAPSFSLRISFFSIVIRIQRWSKEKNLISASNAGNVYYSQYVKSVKVYSIIHLHNISRDVSVNKYTT